MTAAQWRPILEGVLQEYVLDQKGFMTEINCHNLLQFMVKRGSRWTETEEDQRRMSQQINVFLADFFGPLWFGTKYRKFSSRGKSLFVGTDNILDLIKYEGKM